MGRGDKIILLIVIPAQACLSGRQAGIQEWAVETCFWIACLPVGGRVVARNDIKIMAIGENIDSRLLRNQDEENDAARKLKEKKRGEADEEDGEEAEAAGEPRSLRQRIQAARQALNIKEQAKKKIEEKVAAPAKAGTSKILRKAWQIMFSVVGFIPGLLYINIHVFLKSVFGEKLFCKLGEEWIPKKIPGADGEASKMAGKSIGLVEVMGLLFLDVIMLFLILAVLGLLVMIATWLGASWWGKLGMIYDALKSMGWATIQALVLLFS